VRLITINVLNEIVVEVYDRNIFEYLNGDMNALCTNAVGIGR
jgi:hypothetical protein